MNFKKLVLSVSFLSVFAMMNTAFAGTTPLSTGGQLNATINLKLALSNVCNITGFDGLNGSNKSFTKHSDTDFSLTLTDLKADCNTGVMPTVAFNSTNGQSNGFKLLEKSPKAGATAQEIAYTVKMGSNNLVAGQNTPLTATTQSVVLNAPVVNSNNAGEYDDVLTMIITLS